MPIAGPPPPPVPTPIPPFTYPQQAPFQQPQPLARPQPLTQQQPQSQPTPQSQYQLVIEGKQPTTEPLKKTFYRRDLPQHLTSFTSPHGRRLFKDCVQSSTAEIYFSLSGNFTTQSEPAFCGLGSLAMVLNALAVDPGRAWKGVWRWYSDEMLECCRPLDEVRKRGVTFGELACLARCNGLDVVAKRADQVTKEEFLHDLEMCASSEDTHMIVSFSRKTLGQTGDGHFSPVGAYHKGESKALVLDTARFKYPSYFVDASLLYSAMQPLDAETNLPRGYFILRRGDPKPNVVTKIEAHTVDWIRLTGLYHTNLPGKFRGLDGGARVLEDVVRVVLGCLPKEEEFFLSFQAAGIDLAGPVGERGRLMGEHEGEISAVVAEAKQSGMWDAVKKVVLADGKIAKTDEQLALMTIFMLALPGEYVAALPSGLAAEMERCREGMGGEGGVLRREVKKVREQVEMLLNGYCRCGKRVWQCNGSGKGKEGETAGLVVE
ncbi:hypothetical protein HDV00_007608 [Rhizophlyctis rosea]|nr:hypothetical protein HDV00_007608 [Rhizophlyctis rosea]